MTRSGRGGMGSCQLRSPAHSPFLFTSARGVHSSKNQFAGLLGISVSGFRLADLPGEKWTNEGENNTAEKYTQRSNINLSNSPLEEIFWMLHSGRANQDKVFWLT